jgi:hypothetical protein
VAQITNVEIKCQGGVIAKADYAEIGTPADGHKLIVPNAQWVGTNFKDALKYLQKDCQLKGTHPPNGSPFNATMKLTGIKGANTIHFD